MAQRKYKNSAVAVFYLLITLGLLSKFLVTEGIPHHGDFSFPVFTGNWMKELYPLWNESTSASNFQNVNRAIFLAPFIFVFDFFSLKMEWLIKFLVYVLFFSSFLLAHISIRFFVLKNLSKRVDRHYLELSVFLGAVILTLNPWVLDRVYAIFFWVAYIVTLPILVLTYKLLRKLTFYHIFLFTLLFSYAALTPHYLVFTFCIVSIFIAIEISFSDNKILLLKNAVKTLIFVLLMFCVLNVYWIIPTIQVLLQAGVDPGYPVTLDNISIFSRNSTLINVVRGTDAWISWLDWYGSQKKATGIGWFLWQVASFSGLITYVLFIKQTIVKQRIKIFLSIVLLIAVFIAQGFSNFISGFYRWLIFDSPASSLGWIFRDPNKFSGYIWIVYSITTVFVLVGIVHAKRRYFKIKIMVCFIAFAFVIFPKVNGYLYNYLLPVNLPSAYYSAYAFLVDNQDSKYKTIFIAPYEQFEGSNLNYGISHTWNNSRIAANSIIRSSPVSSFGFYHYTNPFAQMYDYIYPNNELENIGLSLGKIGVQYLLYHSDVTNTEKQVEKDLDKFNADKDLALVFQEDFVYIYKINKPSISKITFYNNYGLVNGGLAAKNIIDKTIDDLPIIFQQQDLENTVVANENKARIKINYTGKYSDTNILQLSHRTIWATERYSDNKQSAWAYIQVHNKYQTNRPWHAYVENFLQVHNKREFDFQKGVIATHKKDVEYYLGDSNVDGQKNVYMRLFKNRHGGEIEIAIGNDKRTVSTFSVDDRFEVVHIGKFNIKKAEKIILKNIRGHNVINYLVILSDKRTDKIFDNGNVFIADTNYPLRIDGKDNYIANIFANIYVDSDKKLSTELNDGVLTVNSIVADSTVAEFKKGDNLVKKYRPIKSINLVPQGVDYINEGINKLQDSDTVFRVNENATWERVESDVIESKNSNIFLSFDINYWGIKQFHVRVDFLDVNKEYIGYNILNKGLDGNGSILIREALVPPKGSQYFKVSYMSVKTMGDVRVEVDTAYAELFGEYSPVQQIIAIDEAVDIKVDFTELKYIKKNAAEYKISIKNTSAGIIQFIESYDKLWRMKLKDGNVLKAVQVNSVFNGFIIEEGWDIDGAVIYYLPQEYYKELLKISFLVFFLLGGCAMYKYLKIKGVKK